MSQKFHIPYGKQQINDNDIEAVIRVLKSDLITTGPVIDKFETNLANKVSANLATVCSSGTAALHLAIKALDIKSGDLVIVPTITFLATANATRYAGADILFCDVEPDTGLIDIPSLERLCEEQRGKIAAIMPVHLGGQSPDLISISEIAENHNILVVEDASHAIGSKYYSGSDDVNVGSCLHSKITTFSFHPVKNMTMGEGGATLTNDQKIDDKIKLLRNHGIKRSTNPQTPWVYKMDDVGYNYRASDINCALGLSQLDRLDQFVKKRCELVSKYDHYIKELDPLVKPIDRRDGKPAWHLYVVLIDFDNIKISRGSLIGELKKLGVGTQVHYIPVHTQPYYKNLYGKLQLPGAEQYYKKCLSLPVHMHMEEQEVEYVVRSLGRLLGVYG